MMNGMNTLIAAHDVTRIWGKGAAAQIGVAPPSFVFFTNVATTFHFSYERFLVNAMRDAFGFVGTPIRIQVRRRREGSRAPKKS